MLAFLSVEHLCEMSIRVVYKISHANGASFFFIVVYLHLFRGLYYGSYFYPTYVVVLGVIILLLMIITSFSDMYYMGANVLSGGYVITNLALQYLLWSGNCKLVWSGFSVDNPT